MLSVDEFLQFLLLFNGIIFCYLWIFYSLLPFKFLQFTAVFVFLCNNILQDWFFIKQISVFSVRNLKTNIRSTNNTLRSLSKFKKKKLYSTLDKRIFIFFFLNLLLKARGKAWTHVITGLWHGWSDNEQQSKLLIESLPIRRWLVP